MRIALDRSQRDAKVPGSRRRLGAALRPAHPSQQIAFGDL
jgi:hypothetical protein